VSHPPSHHSLPGPHQLSELYFCCSTPPTARVVVDDVVPLAHALSPSLCFSVSLIFPSLTRGIFFKLNGLAPFLRPQVLEAIILTRSDSNDLPVNPHKMPLLSGEDVDKEGKRLLTAKGDMVVFRNNSEAEPTDLFIAEWEEWCNDPEAEKFKEMARQIKYACPSLPPRPHILVLESAASPHDLRGQHHALSFTPAHFGVILCPAGKRKTR
jgi:hypothetical protein